MFLEPERAIQFRVSYLDDQGAVRTHRGYRVQYSSTLGPYEGPLHFGPEIDSDMVKGMGFATTFQNALTGVHIGGAAGGSNFDPSRASEPEIQRFCQAYMSELAKYIGEGTDLPSIGWGVGRAEVGYLYGQYKRASHHYSQYGRGLLWGGALAHPEAYGVGIVSFAQHLLKDRGETLEGKRCIITGSGKTALAVAARLMDLGAVPLCLSDRSGHVYEPDGISEPKLRQLTQIKAERGARIGRYIIASTTAKFNDPPSIFDIPCDLAFPCAAANEITYDAAATLAANGCQAIIDGGHSSSTARAIRSFKKLGISYAPYKATLAAGTALMQEALTSDLDNATLIKKLDAKAFAVYDEIKRTANEYNMRGDLKVGSDIASFLRVANVMSLHGAI